MTLSTLLLDLLYPLVVFGIPVAVFIGIGRRSRPAHERTMITRWAWTDLYHDFRQGLRVSSANSPLAELMEDTSASTTRSQAAPPQPGPNSAVRHQA